MMMKIMLADVDSSLYLTLSVDALAKRTCSRGDLSVQRGVMNQLYGLFHYNSA